MSPQFDNKIMSSFFLWFDHTLLKKGQAYANGSSLFYRTHDKYGSLFSYSAPYKPLVADSSVTGAIVMSGVYLNGDFVRIGQSGLIDINYQHATLYFDHALPANTQISGNFGLKEMEVKISDEPEEKLLFETKFDLRPKFKQNITGLAEHQYSYPAIFLKNAGGSNIEGAFGGMDWTNFGVRAIVMAENEFTTTAIASLFKDRVRTLVPLFEASEMPFNSLGGLVGGTYNYVLDTSGKVNGDNSIFIEKVAVSTLRHSAYSYLQTLNPNVYSVIVDFDLKTLRCPRI